MSAVEYSRSLLNEGDTLVFIDYPGNRNAYDASGFPLKKTHRVHSDNLLATGSKVFTKLLSEWEQHKARRRKGYLRDLPPGVKFILDLTPPGEGEEALDLTTNLSCSPGVLKWKEVAMLHGVPPSLVGGKDEVMISQGQGLSDEQPPIFSDTSLSECGDVTEIIPDLPAPPVRHESISSGKKPSTNASNLPPIPHDPGSTSSTTMESQQDPQFIREGTSGQHLVSYPWGENTRTQVEVPADSTTVPTLFHNMRDRITEQTSGVDKGSDHFKGQPDDEEKLLDYCPIRHRAGIERLLQVIEGKSPRLDSAPKVWTLVMLAKHFDCTSAVVSLRPSLPSLSAFVF